MNKLCFLDVIKGIGRIIMFLLECLLCVTVVAVLVDTMLLGGCVRRSIVEAGMSAEELERRERYAQNYEYDR
ncbi:MAG: hypothetical protein LBG97_03335 [Coriobacteriales bacterium]|nr:hypothetical protein [Coriobacteriales bacterium]